MIAASPVPASVHLPAFLQGLTPGKITLAAVGLAVVVVILRLTKALGRVAALLAKATAPAAAPAKSGGVAANRFALLAVLAGGVLLTLRAAHHGGTAIAGGRPAVPSPSPSPQPTVTRTVAPHASPHFTLPHLTFLDHLTGTDWVLIVLIGAVVTFALVRPLLRRSDS